MAQDNFDIDAMLDGTLDDLADIPEFRPFPAGSYRLNFHIEADTEKKAIYYGRIKNLETLELNNDSELPMEIGGEAGIRYDLSNEYAQSAFKKILASLAEHFGAKSNRLLIEDAKSPVEVIAILRQTTNKKNGKVYNDIVEMKVA